MKISNEWKWGNSLEINSEKEKNWWPLACYEKSSGEMVDKREK